MQTTENKVQTFEVESTSTNQQQPQQVPAQQVITPQYSQNNQQYMYPQQGPPPPGQPIYINQPPQYAQQPFPQQQGGVIVVQGGGQEQDLSGQQLLCNSSRFPIQIQCPYCNKKGPTKVDYSMGGGSWCCVLILWLFLCCVCCIPCFYSNCQNANHYCAFCGQAVGCCEYKACS